MDQHPQFKGGCIIMDNASIHTADNIEKLIVSRDYGRVFLPPYSPELNSIEQFWFAVKSKLNKENLLENETLTLRITDVCNNILPNDLQGFCRYSASKLEVCYNRNPL
jgi:transposase